MCSVGASAPQNTQPTYIHNPYLDGGAYGNSVDANRIGTSALTIGLDPSAAAAVSAGTPTATSPLAGLMPKTGTQNPNISPTQQSTTQPVSGGPVVSPLVAKMQL